MTRQTAHLEPGWDVHWSSPGRGEWSAARSGRTIGEVRREPTGYVAVRGRRTVGSYPTLSAALDAVDRTGLATDRPTRTWTGLLVAINLAIFVSLVLLAAAVLR